MEERTTLPVECSHPGATALGSVPRVPRAPHSQSRSSYPSDQFHARKRFCGLATQITGIIL